MKIAISPLRNQFSTPVLRASICPSGGTSQGDVTLQQLLPIRCLPSDQRFRVPRCSAVAESNRGERSKTLLTIPVCQLLHMQTGDRQAVGHWKCFRKTSVQTALTKVCVLKCRSEIMMDCEQHVRCHAWEGRLLAISELKETSALPYCGSLAAR